MLIFHAAKIILLFHICTIYSKQFTNTYTFCFKHLYSQLLIVCKSTYIYNYTKNSAFLLRMSKICRTFAARKIIHFFD